MNNGVMNAHPGADDSVDEDDECFMTRPNGGMIMRGLCEQPRSTSRLPERSSFTTACGCLAGDQIGASFTYYYLAPEARHLLLEMTLDDRSILQMGWWGSCT